MFLAYYSNYSYYTNYLFQIGWNLWALEYYTSSITANLFSMSFPFKAFRESLRLCLLETQEPFSTTCATSFRAHPATAGREPATDAGCGMSTRGHWDGPVICNEWKGSWLCDCATWSVTWRKVPCEHDNSPCLEPAPVWYTCPVPLPLGSSGCASVRWALDRVFGSEADLCSSCGGAKTVLCTVWRGPWPKWKCTHHWGLAIFLPQ